MTANDQHLFHGVHIFGEIYGVDPLALDDVKLLETILTRGIEASGASLCSIQVKEFEPSGVTVLALLSESHASIHTYPDKGALFFDAFTCGDRCQPDRIAFALIDELKAEFHSLTTITRGQTPGQPEYRKSHEYVAALSSSGDFESHVAAESL